MRRSLWVSIRVPLVIVLTMVLSLTLLVELHLGFRADRQAAYARVEYGAEYADTRCGMIEYARRGQGPPVLVVHGSGGGFDQGLLFFGALAERGHQVIAVSRFGYLGTPLPQDASAEAQADAYACLLDALSLDDVAVIGASAGAPSSVQFALRHPGRVSSLVLLVPALYAERDEGEPSVSVPRWTEALFSTALRSDALFWLATRVAETALLEGVLATPRTLVDSADMAEQERVAAVIEGILPVRPRRAGLLNDARILRDIPRYPYESIVIPTLTIAARDDLFGTHDAALHAAQSIPGAGFASFPHGGHLLVGYHQEVLDLIAAFISEGPS